MPKKEFTCSTMLNCYKKYTVCRRKNTGYHSPPSWWLSFQCERHPRRNQHQTRLCRGKAPADCIGFRCTLSAGNSAGPCICNSTYQKNINILRWNFAENVAHITNLTNYSNYMFFTDFCPSLKTVVTLAVSVLVWPWLLRYENIAPTSFFSIPL